MFRVYVGPISAEVMVQVGIIRSLRHIQNTSRFRSDWDRFGVNIHIIQKMHSTYSLRILVQIMFMNS